MDNIEQEVRNYIVETFLFGQGGDQLLNDDSLLEKGIIDSTGVLELISFLEENYKMTIEDEELIPENLDSVNRVVKFIDLKQKIGK